MKDFLITLFLGWLGVHRFMQKKYVTGAIWLCTLGLCGFGWAVDTLIAFVRMVKGTQPQKITESEQRFVGGTACPPAGKQLVKSFDTVIVGTFAKCDLDREEKREDVIMRIKPKYELDLKLWFYKKEPAYYVCYCGLDAGNVRAGLAKILYEEYRDCEFKVTALERGYDDRNDCITQNIRIDIYTYTTNDLTDVKQDTSNYTKTFTRLQLEGMKKSDIMELAEELGYTMTIAKSDTKERIVANFMEQQEKKPSTDKRKRLIKTFKTEIVGTFAKCDLDKSYEREEVVCSLKTNSKLSLEYWEYKGEPAFYVCNKGLDAGCVPATISKTLHEVYEDCELVVILRGEANYNDHNDLIQKIQIDVYK